MGSPCNFATALGSKNQADVRARRRVKLDYMRIRLSTIPQSDGMVWYGIVEFNVPLDTV